jgi:hypothetical protein
LVPARRRPAPQQVAVAVVAQPQGRLSRAAAALPRPLARPGRAPPRAAATEQPERDGSAATASMGAPRNPWRGGDVGGGGGASANAGVAFPPPPGTAAAPSSVATSPTAPRPYRIPTPPCAPQVPRARSPPSSSMPRTGKKKAPPEGTTGYGGGFWQRVDSIARCAILSRGAR